MPSLRQIAMAKKCQHCEKVRALHLVTDFNLFVCTFCAAVHRSFGHTVRDVQKWKTSHMRVREIENGSRNAPLWYEHDVPPAVRETRQKETSLKDYLARAYKEEEWLRPAGGAVPAVACWLTYTLAFFAGWLVLAHVPSVSPLYLVDAVANMSGPSLETILSPRALLGVIPVHASPLWSALYATVSAMFVVFGSCVLYDNVSVYDPFWIVWTPWLSLYWAYQGGGLASLDVVEVVMIVLVWVWSFRFCLGVPWSGWTRGLAEGSEDWRYVAMRRTLSVQRGNDIPWIWWWNCLLCFVLVPTILVYLASLPLAKILIHPGPHSVSLRSSVLIGAVHVVILGIVIEGVADRQMRRFRRTRAYQTGGTLRTGLWGYSRHPNYFGEFLFWFGILLVAMALRVVTVSWPQIDVSWTTFRSLPWLIVDLLQSWSFRVTENVSLSIHDFTQSFVQTTQSFADLPRLCLTVVSLVSSGIVFAVGHGLVFISAVVRLVLTVQPSSSTSSSWFASSSTPAPFITIIFNSSDQAPSMVIGAFLMFCLFRFASVPLMDARNMQRRGYGRVREVVHPGTIVEDDNLRDVFRESYSSVMRRISPFMLWPPGACELHAFEGATPSKRKIK